MTTTVLAAPEAGREAGRTDPRRTERRHVPGPGRRSGWFGQLLLRLHFYAGILVGPFILVAALSGALYALTPAIEQVVYRHELHVPTTDTSVSDGQLTLAEQTAIAQAYLGDGATPSAVRPAPGPGDTTRIMFTGEGLGDSESRAVFVDPSTGEVRGDLTVYGTSGALPLRNWVSNLHGDLHLGDVGRVYSELAASWLAVVALAGLGLWAHRFRTSRARRDFVRPARGRSGYRRVFTWHASVGIWVLLGAVFLSATGISWSLYAGDRVGDLRAALDWETPAVDPVLPAGAGAGAGAGSPDAGADGGTGDAASPDAGGHAHHRTDAASGATPGAASEATPGATAADATADPAAWGERLDAVLATAQGVNVNTGLVEIRPPAEPGTAWVVQEVQRSYPSEVDAVAIDGDTLRVTDRTDFADFPLAAKLTRWGIDAHMGSLFGLANQIALFGLACGIAAMVVLGYLMWWRRRPTREPRPLAGRPPRRGALRRAPWWGTAAVVAVAVLVGWWLPLVGYPLAGFVVLDALVGARSGRRGAEVGAARPSVAAARRAAVVRRPGGR
ncbi:PepSY-associated TM helix domain-containing protein [Promicromonospora panici]|uniref:PepSY-associated TM helix domain-containing protein n=1 Tax=Promicromonospora panici TaxID=2219658 RepID=UPI00101D7496|nr:PepSY-associated TM helix domain-containing protein [Promicromonospora panici]